MDWREHIVADKDVLAGKPSIKGTRLSVELVLELLAGGWTQERILANYPRLMPEALRAVFGYAQALLDVRVGKPEQPALT